jgi:hypothetical protein
VSYHMAAETCTVVQNQTEVSVLERMSCILLRSGQNTRPFPPAGCTAPLHFK